MNLESYKKLGWNLRTVRPPFIYVYRFVGQHWISVEFLSNHCGLIVGILSNQSMRLWFKINNIKFFVFLLDIAEEFITSNEVGNLMGILEEENKIYDSCCTPISIAENTLEQLLLGGCVYGSG